MFDPIRTARLLLRAPRREDIGALVARRSDPEVARLQSWEAPYPVQRATELMEAIIEQGGPVSGEWWMLTIADSNDTVVYGDLAVSLEWEGRAAEVGYTLASGHWGRGYATEALDGLLDRLFADPALTRVHAMLHPDNHASARVLENTGFVFEGRTRLSYWVGDENSDDVHYGMTRSDRETWLGRPLTPPADVTLVEIDQGNYEAVRRLHTHKSQERMASPVLVSMADALYPEIVDGAPSVPWLRAIAADGELAGFLMLAESTEAHAEPELWRLLIDRMHQRRGIGRRVLDLVVEQCRRWGDASLIVHWVDGVGSPRRFYEEYGFVPTGNLLDGEIQARLEIS